MKQTEDCEIIQDLLPNYIENLTSVVTNNYIEKHIKDCKICSEKIKNMTEEIKQEKINPSKELNIFKKVKNRYRLITLFCTCIIFVIIFGLFYFNQNYKFYKDENNKISIKRITFDKNNYSDNTYLIIKTKQLEKNTLDGYTYNTIFISLNAENKCINIRQKVEGYTSEGIANIKDFFNRMDGKSPMSNLKIEDSTIYYNDNNYNGKLKDDIVKEYQKLRNFGKYYRNIKKENPKRVLPAAQRFKII